MLSALIHRARPVLSAVLHSSSTLIALTVPSNVAAGLSIRAAQFWPAVLLLTASFALTLLAWLLECQRYERASARMTLELEGVKKRSELEKGLLQRQLTTLQASLVRLNHQTIMTHEAQLRGGLIGGEDLKQRLGRSVKRAITEQLLREMPVTETTDDHGNVTLRATLTVQRP